MAKQIKDAGVLEGAVYSVFTKYKERDKEKGLTTTLPLAKFRELIFSKCHYCGGSPEEGTKTQYWDGEFFFMRNGVDKIDPKKAYTEKNSVACCLLCENHKANFEGSDWLRWVHSVAENTKGHPCLKSTSPLNRRKATGRIQVRLGQESYMERLENEHLTEDFERE